MTQSNRKVTRVWPDMDLMSEKRECSIRWCNRQAVQAVARKTGYEFYVCKQHLDAMQGIPAEGYHA